jgi:hypothetical protein
VTKSQRDEKRIQNYGRKPEGKRPVGNIRSRWDDNIRMDHREIEWKVVGELYSPAPG